MTRPESAKPYQSSRLAAWFAPKQLGRQAVLEVAGLTLLLVLLCAWAQPDDPFLLNRPFAWLWLLPAVLALRYGTMAAFLSAGLLLLLWFLLPLFGLGGGSFPASFFLGGLILTLIAGEFADVWIARLRRVREANAFLTERLESLTRRHYLLRLSHERLEQELLVKPMTLRDALQRMRKLMVREPASQALPHAQEFLHLLSQACQLEVASLHRLQQGRLEATAQAAVGEISALDHADPLLRYALERGQLAHVQTEGLPGDSSRYLVVAPLASSADEVHGLLLVERLPFLSLNEETLRFMAVLLGYYADGISMGRCVQPLLQQLPQCSPLFANELLRLHRIWQEAGIPSMLVALTVAPGLHQQEIMQEAQRQTRQLDVVWEATLPGLRCLLTVMPLHGEAAMTGYVLRTERWLHEHYGYAELAEAGVVVHGARIGTDAPEVLLGDLLKRCQRMGAA